MKLKKGDLITDINKEVIFLVTDTNQSKSMLKEFAELGLGDNPVSLLMVYCKYHNNLLGIELSNQCGDLYSRISKDNLRKGFEGMLK